MTPVKKNIAVIEGDGTGPELTRQAVKILNAIADQFGHEFNYQYPLLGAAAVVASGSTLPAATIDACLDSDAVLTGAVTANEAFSGLGKALQLYAQVLPVSAYASLQYLSPHKTKNTEGADFILFRDWGNGITVDEHAGDEAAMRLAFKTAQRKRKKITAIYQSEDLLATIRWRDVVIQVAAQYNEVVLDFLSADVAVIQLITNPNEFDVMLTENICWDFIVKEASVIGGVPGLLPAAYKGNKNAIFGAAFNADDQSAGKDIVNPIGSILSAALLLEHFDLKEEAALVKEAVAWTINNQFVAKDIEPVNFYFTATIGELVGDYIANKIPGRLNKENIELRKSTII
jgi:3-isopropylmalate dehydrogenase